MKMFQLPSCPYCDKKINYIATWVLRREGEFRCPRCRGISNIILDFKLALFATGTVVISALLFLFLILVFKIESIAIIILIISPILLFYILSVFFVRLKKPVMKKRRRKTAVKQNVSKNWSYIGETEKTRIL